MNKENCALKLVGEIIRHRRNLRDGGWGREANGHNIFFQLSSFFIIELRGENKKWCDSGVEICMYIKDRLKPIFALFLTCLFRKFKFLIPTVVAAPSGRAV